MSVPRPRAFQVARFDPRTGQLIGASPRQPLLGNPLQRFRRRGLGDVPSPSGGPGNPVYPYTEEEVWNDFAGGGVSAPPAMPATVVNPGTATATATATGATISAPFGESDRAWSNPNTFATVPINAATPANIPILSQNAQRSGLILQNNSTATSPDVAPTFYVGFNSQPIAGFAVALAPGVGFFWDIITPRDSIYILIGAFSGASVVIAGCAVQSTYAPLLALPV